MTISCSRLFLLPCAVGMIASAWPSTIVFAAQEQIEFPPASQHGWIKQRIGLTDVEIDYSRPNKNGRRIFGGLLPYGKVWRTGANASTKIKFSDAVKVGGKNVAGGEYAFYTIPNENEWTIILSKDTKEWGAYQYKSDADVLRVVVKPEMLSAPVETFTIGLSDLRMTGQCFTSNGTRHCINRARHKYGREAESADRGRAQESRVTRTPLLL